jgi:Prolyl oligopeptidase family
MNLRKFHASVFVGIPTLLFALLPFVRIQSSPPRPAASIDRSVQVQVSNHQASRRRPFVVKDSIEVSYFVNYTVSAEDRPRPTPIFSPNRKHFIVITERGILTTNRTESTIWLFDRQAVSDYVLSRTSTKPVPEAIATLSAVSNMPVISGVRWLDDSQKLAFLGKDGSPYQQLFIADVKTRAFVAVTKREEFVSGYDINGDTIAYTTLIMNAQPQDLANDLETVGGKNIDSLLFPEQQEIENLQWEDFYDHPTALHVQRNGTELPLSFNLRGKAPRLFPSSWSLSPPLAISPDGNWLITVAPVPEVPPEWESYQPHPDMDNLRLKRTDKNAVAEGNPYKPLQFVQVDLRTGQLSPLVDAPLARNLGYSVPTKVFWFSDSGRAILCNTFLPLGATRDAGEREQRARNPVVTVVDVSTHTLQPITYLHLPAFHGAAWYRVADILWDSVRSEVTLTYRGNPESKVPPSDTYVLRSGEWIKTSSSALQSANASDGDTDLWVDEGPDRSPVLVGRHHGALPASVIWDPNPQLESIALGKVSLYHWVDKDGNSWSGLLAMPPDYQRTRRYPLVIQTHGYDPKKYFVDGMYTTGSGGRALTAKGVIVLQMDMPLTHIFTPADAPFEMGGFEAAIESLATEGLVDRQRVGVIGFSFTCFHTLYALTHHPDMFAAATITDGNNMSYSQYIFDETGGSFQKASEGTNGGVPWGHFMNWVLRSPDFNLEKVETPLLISALERGQLLRQWEPYAGLRRLGKPVDMLWLRHSDVTHVLVKPYHRYVSQQSAVDWFDFWLNGNEDRDPAKAGQYGRWRELRTLKQQKTPQSKGIGLGER